MSATAVDDALVVIVHFGDPDPTLSLANALIDFTTDVTVVANDRMAPPDGLAEQVRWLRPERNLGYAGAAMYATDQSPVRPYVVILNNDMVLPEATFRRCLDDLREDPCLGLVGPLLRFPDGTLQSGAGGTRGVLRWGDYANDPGRALVRCDWISGAAMFLSSTALDICGWDTSYFLGFEDLDLSRGVADAGFAVACDGRVEAVHLSGATIGGHWSYYYIRNRLWYSRKHHAPWRTVLIATNACYIGVKSVFGDVRHRRRFAQSRLFLNGVLDGLRPSAAHLEEPMPDEPRAAAISQRAERSDVRAWAAEARKN